MSKRIVFGDVILLSGSSLSGSKTKYRCIGGKKINGAVVIQYANPDGWRMRGGPAEVEKYRPLERLCAAESMPALAKALAGSVPYGELEWHERKKIWKQRSNQTSLL